jgi:multiple sugar transport system substrate-binding protein
VVDFEIVVRPIPQFDPEHPVMISQGPSVCVFNKEDPQEVLASWLFAQYLLSNDVQVGYALTEGYVPVTLKAQQTAEYQDYLSRKGEDNEKYYSVKLDAAELLMANTANTFVTPVFNGSASLRDAAGQMIENVVKSVRRHETLDGEYMTKLQRDVTALYRLDQFGDVTASGIGELGPMPATSKALLMTLAAVWAGLGVLALCRFVRRRRR